MAAFPKEISALIRSTNAAAIATRLQLSSSDSSKRQFVDSLVSKQYQARARPCHKKRSSGFLYFSAADHWIVWYTRASPDGLSDFLQATLSECERAMQHDWAELVCHCAHAALGKKTNKLDDAFKHQVRQDHSVPQTIAKQRKASFGSHAHD
jgi:hypothetical protein